jgi:hypothetical protein
MGKFISCFESFLHCKANQFILQNVRVETSEYLDVSLIPTKLGINRLERVVSIGIMILVNEVVGRGVCLLSAFLSTHI